MQVKIKFNNANYMSWQTKKKKNILYVRLGMPCTVNHYNHVAIARINLWHMSPGVKKAVYPTTTGSWYWWYFDYLLRGTIRAGVL